MPPAAAPHGGLSAERPVNSLRGAPSGSHAALRLVGITKRFPGVLANDDVSLDVRKGEVLGLLGENGAGKTTLMNIVYGLYKPDGGQIFVNGREVEIKSPAARAGAGDRDGAPALHAGAGHDGGREHRHGPVPAPRPHRGSRRSSARSPSCREQFGLNVDPRSTVSDLTVGARQRVEIIKLLYRGADLLILDEPTAALTPPEWHELAIFMRATGRPGPVGHLHHPQARRALRPGGSLHGAARRARGGHREHRRRPTNRRWPR